MSPAATGKLRRARNGCLVCRARRIKCDVGKPECARCVTYGAECAYPEKRPFDANKVQTALAKRHRQTSTGSPASATSHVDTCPSPPAAAASSTTLPPLEAIRALCRLTKMGEFFAGPSEPPPFLRHAFPLDTDLQCFHHCLTYSLSILTVNEDANPWVEHVARLFLFPTGEAPISTDALKHGMLAVGATHLAYLHAQADPQAESARAHLATAARYRKYTMTQLQAARSLPNEAGHVAFLAACNMVATHDVLGAHPSWREPVRYAREAILAQGGCGRVLFGAALDGDASLPLPPPPPALRYVIESLVLVDTVAALSSGSRVCLLVGDTRWWHELGRTGSTERDWESIERSIGVHRTLMPVSSQVIDLVHDMRVHEQRHGRLTPATSAELDLLTRIGAAEVALATWHAETIGRRLDTRTHIGSLALWHAMSILVGRDLHHVERQAAACQTSAAAILELCVEVGDKIEYMNWPLVIACAVLVDDGKRAAARNVLDAFAYQCCSEIKVIRVVVEEMWARMDAGRDDEACSWREVALELGYPVLLG